MEFLAKTILPYILLYKYWALAGVTFLASLAIPIPAGTLLVASAAFASQGYFNIITVLVVVIVANIAGDSVCFWLARFYGKRILMKIGLRKVIQSKNFTLIEGHLKERPGLIIFVSRFEVLATLTVNLVSGLSGVSYKRFLAYETLGAVADAGFYGMIGYLFGDSWEAVNKLIGNFSLVIFLILALCIVLFWKKIMANLSTEQVIKHTSEKS